MLYPAPNAIGLFAAVLTRGLLVESAKQDQKKKFQSEADKVLLPYLETLSQYTSKDLMRRGLEMTSIGGHKELLDEKAAPQGEWLISSVPLFSFTQDQRAIVLDNVVSIAKSAMPEVPAFQGAIRVVSPAKRDDDLAKFWTANQGERLKSETAGLFAESLDIALAEVVGSFEKAASNFRTVRYFEGDTEKIERAQIVSERCDRLVLRTLRGSLMSVPAICKP